jgi:CRP/FNR family cyclic AMP-dependent transcriptional regulator
MARQPVLEVLRRQPFTRGLTEGQLEKLLSFTSEVSFGEDQLIFPAGRPSGHLYLVLSGCVCVEVRTLVYAVCVQVVGPGEAFGWSSLLDRHDTVFQVRALAPTTTLCFDAKQLQAACVEDPKFGFELLRRVLELVAGRVEAVEARLAEFCGIAGPPKSRRVAPRCCAPVAGVGGQI